MITHFPIVFSTSLSELLTHFHIGLANTQSSQIPAQAYQRASSLMLMFIILSLIILMMLALLIVFRRARRRKQALNSSKPTTHTDAWSESGKRFDSSIVEIDPDQDLD